MASNKTVYQVFISPEEAKRLIPIIEEKRSTRKAGFSKQTFYTVLEELSEVNPKVDYSPLHGKQMRLSTAPFRLITTELQKVRAEIAKENMEKK